MKIGTNLTLTPGPSTLVMPEDTAEAFAAMEQEALEGERSQSLSDGIRPCETPYLELTLLDEDGEPAAFARYSVAAGGARQSGTLDENGHVRIDGVDVSADQVMLKVLVVDDASQPDDQPVYEIQLVPIEAPLSMEREGEPEPDLAPYFHPSFDHRQLPAGDE
jgi:hypothetical protein